MKKIFLGFAITANVLVGNPALGQTNGLSKTMESEHERSYQDSHTPGSGGWDDSEDTGSGAEASEAGGPDKEEWKERTHDSTDPISDATEEGGGQDKRGWKGEPNSSEKQD